MWLLIGILYRLSCRLGFAFCVRMLSVFVCKHKWFVSTIPLSGRLLWGRVRPWGPMVGMWHKVFFINIVCECGRRPGGSLRSK